ncbi:hypothetical protein ACIHEJ_07595 [Streptomyces sp. NPDC052301]|uniref:hypothetical protein n=1 Tax=Streptomyces sp. NPDC052301 TaxID=3365687 RepID=UPI0037CDDDB6
MIAAQPRDGGHPVQGRAHFRHSADGTRTPERALLYTKWPIDEAHREAAEAGHHDKRQEIPAGTTGLTADPPKTVPS